jgi:chromosome partitioning protein
MSRILAIANQKGGVGKTTTAVNLAASLAELGQRVLLADLDPQGNATMGAGIEKRTALPTVYQILLNQVSIRDARMRSEPGHFDVIPANRELAGAEIDLVNLEQRDLRLKVALEQVADDYDFILMDCPPTLNLLTVNAFAAAQSVLIPDAVRVLRAGRADRSGRHHQEGQAAAESGHPNRRTVACDVRSAKYAGATGVGSDQAAFR